MYFVYFLRSESSPDQVYTGMTANLQRRLEEHNSGKGGLHTKKFMPWKVEACVLADTLEIASAAERYFKNSAGKEKFKHFSSQENPIQAFFSAQEVGRKFGTSSFEIGVMVPILTECQPKANTDSLSSLTPSSQKTESNQ